MSWSIISNVVTTVYIALPLDICTFMAIDANYISMYTDNYIHIMCIMYMYMHVSKLGEC